MAKTALAELKDKEYVVLCAITDYIRENRFPPSRKDLMIAVDNPSESMLNRHLAALRDKGYITWMDRSPRSIVVERDVDGKKFRL